MDEKPDQNVDSRPCHWLRQETDRCCGCAKTLDILKEKRDEGFGTAERPIDKKDVDIDAGECLVAPEQIADKHCIAVFLLSMDPDRECRQKCGTKN